MKRLFYVFVMMFVLAANAELVIIVPAPAGGGADKMARSLQRYSDLPVRIENRPGQFSAISFLQMHENPGSVVLADPGWMSNKSPTRNDTNVELLDIVLGFNSYLISSPNKPRDLDDILHGPVNIGVSLLGTPNHYLIHQLQKYNPQIQVIPMNGDNNGLMALIRNDIDAYATAAIFATPNGLAEQYNLKPILFVPSGKTFRSGSVELSSPNAWMGIWISKKATAEQRKEAIRVIQLIKAKDEWRKDMRSSNLTPLNYSEKERNTILENSTTFFMKMKDF